MLQRVAVAVPQTRSIAETTRPCSDQPHGVLGDFVYEIPTFFDRPVANYLVRG
jgi:hypothetical protein